MSLSIHQQTSVPKSRLLSDSWGLDDSEPCLGKLVVRFQFHSKAQDCSWPKAATSQEMIIHLDVDQHSCMVGKIPKDWPEPHQSLERQCASPFDMQLACSYWTAITMWKKDLHSIRGQCVVSNLRDCHSLVLSFDTPGIRGSFRICLMTRGV